MWSFVPKKYTYSALFLSWRSLVKFLYLLNIKLNCSAPGQVQFWRLCTIFTKFSHSSHTVLTQFVSIKIKLNLSSSHFLRTFKVLVVKPCPKTQTPKAQPQPQLNPVKISSKGTGADTKILWATHHHPTPPPPHHPITFKHEGGL